MNDIDRLLPVCSRRAYDSAWVIMACFVVMLVLVVAAVMQGGAP